MRYWIPRAPHHSSTLPRVSAPATWPAPLRLPRRVAQRPLPSMMIATWRGTWRRNFIASSKKRSGVDAPLVTPSVSTPPKSSASSSSIVPARKALAPHSAAICASLLELADVPLPSTSTPNAPDLGGRWPAQTARTASWRSFVAWQTPDVPPTTYFLRSFSIRSATSSAFIVVWLTTPTRSPGRGGGVSTSPAMPFTSSWFGSPSMTTGSPRSEKRFAARCALATNGHVVSTTFSLRAAAVSRTCGETPCAEKTTVSPSGTSSMRSTNLKPSARSSSTTISLWTSAWRQ